MKVVLFCGGLGMRLREYSANIPKPLVQIGYRPILWYILKYYAYYGHKEFILCLGHKADMIKKYFVDYDETISNDFVYSKGGRNIELLNTDIDDWRITFVDTGLDSTIGMRLMAVKDFLKNEDMFLANYSDGLSDLPLNVMIDWFTSQKNKTAAFATYSPQFSFHAVKRNDDGLVTSINHIGNTGLLINTGYFILRKEIFNYINYGEELVDEPFQRLINEQKLVSYNHIGFWASMDTFKDKQKLEDTSLHGIPPWEVWKKKSHVK